MREIGDGDDSFPLHLICHEILNRGAIQPVWRRVKSSRPFFWPSGRSLGSFCGHLVHASLQCNVPEEEDYDGGDQDDDDCGSGDVIDVDDDNDRRSDGRDDRDIDCDVGTSINNLDDKQKKKKTKKRLMMLMMIWKG